MPNWIKGDLKVRGTKENVRKFLLEGLEPIPRGFLNREPVETELICDDEFEFTIKSETGIFYIKNTRRNFIEQDIIETYINEWEDNEERVLVLEDYKSAWGIQTEALAQISKRYNIDFKILGFEQGMEFNQDIEVVKGRIVRNEEIKFNDYQWECIRPHIGG